MRGIVHEPQANLGADQNFSPGRLKTRKGGLSKLGLKIMQNKKRETPEVRTCTFGKQTHLAKSSWETPKHLMLVSYASSLRFLSNLRVSLLHKFCQDQPAIKFKWGQQTHGITL